MFVRSTWTLSSNLWANDPPVYDEEDYPYTVIMGDERVPVSKVYWVSDTPPKEMKPGDIWHDTSDAITKLGVSADKAVTTFRTIMGEGPFKTVLGEGGTEWVLPALPVSRTPEEQEEFMRVYNEEQRKKGERFRGKLYEKYNRKNWGRAAASGKGYKKGR